MGRDSDGPGIPIETSEIALNHVTIGLGNLNERVRIESPKILSGTVKHIPFSLVAAAPLNCPIRRGIHCCDLMGVDRYDVIFPFAFLACLPEYIHAGHVAAIDRSTMEFDSYLGLARNSHLADVVALRRAMQYVGGFRRGSSDPDTQCFDHLVTQLSWVGHLAVRLRHRNAFQILFCYLLGRSSLKYDFFPIHLPDLLDRPI